MRLAAACYRDYKVSGCYDQRGTIEAVFFVTHNCLSRASKARDSSQEAKACAASLLMLSPKATICFHCAVFCFLELLQFARIQQEDEQPDEPPPEEAIPSLKQ